MTRFTPENRAAIIARVEIGESLTTAAAGAGIPLPTVKTWLARGRREEDTAYAEFAARVDAAKPKARQLGDGLLDDDELWAVASAYARRGSVPAMRLVWEILRSRGMATPAAAPTQLDELAERRGRRR